jgi:hypothetical protein
MFLYIKDFEYITRARTKVSVCVRLKEFSFLPNILTIFNLLSVLFNKQKTPLSRKIASKAI